MHRGVVIQRDMEQRIGAIQFGSLVVPFFCRGEQVPDVGDWIETRTIPDGREALALDVPQRKAR